MIDTQLGRRNLSLIQRITVAEKYRDKLKEEAKEKQGQRNDLTSTPKGEKVKESKHTSKELAKLAEVGSGTMAGLSFENLS